VSSRPSPEPSHEFSWLTLVSPIAVIVGSLPALKIFFTSHARKRSRNSPGNSANGQFSNGKGGVPLSSLSSDKDPASRRGLETSDSQENMLKSEGANFVMVKHDVVSVPYKKPPFPISYHVSDGKSLMQLCLADRLIRPRQPTPTYLSQPTQCARVRKRNLRPRLDQSPYHFFCCTWHMLLPMCCRHHYHYYSYDSSSSYCPTHAATTFSILHKGW